MNEKRKTTKAQNDSSPKEVKEETTKVNSSMTDNSSSIKEVNLPPEEDNSEDYEYNEDEFNKYLEMYTSSFKNISEGEIVKGKVIRLTPSEVVVDIGYKSEGIIPIEEFGEPLNIKIGDEVDVLLENLETQDGQIVISKKRADFMKVWDQIKEIYEKGKIIEGKTVRRIKGGLVVNILGVEAFLPGSQIDIKQIKDYDAYVGHNYKFKIIKVNKLRKNIVVSRRAVLEEERINRREELIKTMKKGRFWRLISDKARSKRYRSGAAPKLPLGRLRKYFDSPPSTLSNPIRFNHKRFC